MCILECIFSSHLYCSAGQLLNIFKASSRDVSGRIFLQRDGNKLLFASNCFLLICCIFLIFFFNWAKCFHILLSRKILGTQSELSFAVSFLS